MIMTRSQIIDSPVSHHLVVGVNSRGAPEYIHIQEHLGSQYFVQGPHQQRQKNLGSRVALLPGKFLRVRKVFARINEKTF